MGELEGAERDETEKGDAEAMTGLVLVTMVTTCWCLWLSRRIMRLEAQAKVFVEVMEILKRFLLGNAKKKVEEEEKHDEG